MGHAKERVIFIATTNAGKLSEIGHYLAPLGYSARRLDTTFVEVQADSLEDVVTYGMRSMASEGRSDIMFIKDDSGLFIGALGGFPGVYSAYVNRTISCAGILRLMEGETDRRAVFRTVIGLYEPGRGVSLFKGECKGTISEGAIGTNGFGFDPIFIPEGHDVTFAQMTTEGKNALSHRIRAVERLMEHLGDERRGTITDS